MNPTSLILVIGGGVILTIGDIILKEWVDKSYPYLYVTGIILYLISMNLLAHSYRYQNIAIASLSMVIFNVLTLTLVSHFVFHESFNSYQLTGITLGIIAIILLEI